MKSEFENEIIPKKEKELEIEISKLKSIIEEMSSAQKKILHEKNNEFLNDIKSIELSYKEIIEKQNIKVQDLSGEIEKLNQRLEETTLNKKSSLENEKKIQILLDNQNAELINQKESFLKEKLEMSKLLEDAKQKIKYLELEVRDQNEIILKNETILKNYRNSLNSKDSEVNKAFEDNASLKLNISQLQMKVSSFKIRLKEWRRRLRI